MKVLYSIEQLKQLEKNLDNCVEILNIVFENKVEFLVDKSFGDRYIEVCQISANKYNGHEICSDALFCVEFDDRCHIGDRVKYSPEIGYYLESEDDYDEERDYMYAFVYESECPYRLDLDDLYSALIYFVLSVDYDLQINEIEESDEEVDVDIEGLCYKIYNILDDKGIAYDNFKYEEITKEEGQFHRSVYEYKMVTDSDGSKHIESVLVSENFTPIRHHGSSYRTPDLTGFEFLLPR